MGSTSTLVTGSFSITNLPKNGDFVGVSGHRDHGQALITDRKSTSLYMVSDQQNVGNFTLKTDLLFSHPVVFDYEEEKYVGIVEQYNKKRLCTWSDEQTDYKEWKKKVMLTEVVDILTVQDSEPLLVKSDDSIVWLSQYEDSNSSISLVPERFKHEEIEISAMKVYRVASGKLELIYHIQHQDMPCFHGQAALPAGRSVYMLRFNGKQVTGDHVFMFGGPDLAAVCRCPCPETTYVAVYEDGKIMRYEEGEDENEEFDKLPDELSVRALHMLDNDQLLVASTLTTKSTGCLHVFSLKYKTLTLLKTLSADFAGDRPLTVMSPYIITQTRDNLEAHSYKFSKLSVRQMLGRMTLQSGSDEDIKSKITACVTILEKKISQIEMSRNEVEMTSEDEFSAAPQISTADKDNLHSTLSQYDNSLLLEVLKSYCKSHSSLKWSTKSTKVVTELLAYLLLPSHLLIEVCEAAARHNDAHIIEYLVYKQGELPEQAIISLLSHVIKGIPARDEETEEIMDIDNTDTVLDIPPHITPLIDTLLSKDITDVFATEAMHKMDFSHVLILLKYLCGLLCQDDVALQSSSDEGSSRLCILSEDQISKWCAVILDSHYTQLILSDQAELLVKLHHIVTQQVELQTHILKLGANLSAKPPQKKPTTGPYCMEAVTFYY